MNFDRSLIFSYLEEDNIQRAYFRVRPLLTPDGNIMEEARQLWPNEGGLRVVPDRNEQHTFKTRMRTLGAFCVVDLRGLPAEAGKIRTNKNYHPDRGEVNQYILYSDTVHALPEHTFYHLLDGIADDYAVLAQKAITPLFFIRQDDTIYGPVHRAAPASPEQAAEMVGTLFEVPCPDGINRMIFCIDDAPSVSSDHPAEAPAIQKPDPSPQEAQQPSPAVHAIPAEPAVQPAASSSELPIGQTLHILDENKKHDDTLKMLDAPVSSGANLLRNAPAVQEIAASPALSPKSPLIGTPLIRTPLRVAAQQAKNRTQEVVSNQWNIGKYEPPAENLPTGTAMRAVVNPVENACTALRNAWNATGTRQQLADFMLSLDGLRHLLEVKLCDGESITVMQRVLRQRLEDLEAERLSALCELDKAHRDADSYKQELLSSIASRLRHETSQLESEREKAQQQVDTLKDEMNALTLQRDALLTRVNELQGQVLPETIAKLAAEAQMSAPMAGIPLRLSPVSGKSAPLNELLSLLMAACQKSGVSIDKNYAIAMLVCLAISPRIGIACPTPAPAATLLKNLARAFGWQQSYAHQYAAEQHPVIGIRPIDTTPAVLATNLPNYAPICGAVKLLLSRNTGILIRNAAYDVSQWPVFQLPELPFVPEDHAVAEKAISADSLTALLDHTPVPDSELDTVLGPVLNAALPLGGSARRDLYRFISVCSGLMEGGLPAAVDWGILLWIIPALERGSKYFTAVKSHLDEYPLSFSKL